MAACLPWSIVQQLLPRNLTSFIDGFATGFGQVERFTNIVKAHIYQNKDLFFPIKTKVTSYWDLLSHYKLSFHCSRYCGFVCCFFFFLNPTGSQSRKKYAKNSNRKDMLETQRLSQRTRSSVHEAGWGPPRSLALKFTPW